MVKTANDEMQAVVFQLNEQTYGIDINSVLEIIRMEEITEIPRTPDFIEGVINLRGSVVAVLDLRKRFGLPAREITAHSRIIIVQVGDITFGMIVDAVQEVLRIAKDIIEPAPAMVNGVDAAYIHGIALQAERLIILLNQSRILYQHETDQLANLNVS